MTSGKLGEVLLVVTVHLHCRAPGKKQCSVKEFKDLFCCCQLTKVCSKPSIDCLRAKALILRPFAVVLQIKKMKENADDNGDKAQWENQIQRNGQSVGANQTHNR